MSFKSERRGEKKGNRKFAPRGSNAAQFKRAEVNQGYLGTRVNLRLKSKKNDHGRSF